MSGPVSFPSGITVQGNARINGKIEPAKAPADILAVSNLQAFPIPLTSFRVFDDHKAEASPQSNKARVLVQLPWNYVGGNAVTLRFMAGMITNVADQTATLDCLVFKQQDDPDDAIGSDLYAGSANNMNALAFVNTDFSLTATALSPGDILDVLITTAVDDDATGTAVIAAISWAQLLCDVR